MLPKKHPLSYLMQVLYVYPHKAFSKVILLFILSLYGNNMCCVASRGKFDASDFFTDVYTKDLELCLLNKPQRYGKCDSLI